MKESLASRLVSPFWCHNTGASEALGVKEQVVILPQDRGVIDGTRPSIWAVALLGAVAVAMHAPAWLHGLPLGDSYYLNVVWASAFSESLVWTQPYPRWLASLWNGAGGADFYFYAPLPFYLSAGVKALCPACGIEQSITAAAALLAFVGGVGMYGLARALGFGRLSIVAALFVIVSPHHVLEWQARQALGELAGAAFLPICLHGVLQVRRDGRWLRLCLGVAALSLSHLPSLVVFGTAAVVLGLTIWRPVGLRRFFTALAAGLLGLGISAIYWLPAIWLLPTVRADELGIYDWREAMLGLPPWDPATLYPAIWTPFLVFLALGTIAVALARPATNPARAFVVVCLVLVAVLVTPVSALIWQHTPIDVIQFPWRFLILADIAFAIALALLASLIGAGSAPARRVVAMAALSIAVVFTGMGLKALDHNPRPAFPAPELIEKRATVTEWLGRSDRTLPFSPRTLITDGLPGNLQDLAMPEGVEVTRTTATELRFHSTCVSACDVVFPRTYWHLWRLEDTSTGKQVSTSASAGFPLVQARLPPGVGRYRLYLARPEIEKFAWWLTLASAVLVVGLGATRRRLF